MAVTENNLQIINSMTEEMFSSLKDSNGKIPGLANQLVMTDEENVNFSQTRTKVLWTNNNPSAEFASQQVTLTDSDYDYLLFVFATNDANTQYLSYVTKKGKGVYCSWTYTDTSNAREVNYVNDTTYSITNANRNGTTANYTCIPIQIIGLYEDPAMVYTGGELYEGNHITIKDGVVSSTFKKEMLFDWYQKFDCAGGVIPLTREQVISYNYLQLEVCQWDSGNNGILRKTDWIIETGEPTTLLKSEITIYGERCGGLVSIMLASSATQIDLSGLKCVPYGTNTTLPSSENIFIGAVWGIKL